ncbi:glycoside hydrolase family 25 protein [Fulvivirga sp. 29W222]|uniref:Glycoside hydrolase family 25 protein n=1 Tax=Fulvivirga marina TaxID=2494733 RepID=A0A937G020_9BACT|nr:GH25 family lysozyme [Fulvivirga marina]MBL6446021.1 glycoside hydrolase family 25 protein [Fulvivirga marina]
MRKVFLGIVIAFVLGITGLVLLYTGYIRFNYPDRDEFPVRGIDISHHQGKIRWHELKAELIDFVIIKATEGGDYKDPLFDENWKNSRESGYKTGAYHFYRLCKGGEEQAANFIASVPNEAESLPPTIDLEFGGNCDSGKSRVQIIEEIKVCLGKLEGHFGKTPIIYVTREFYKEYIEGDFLRYPIWIRDIYRQPTLEPNREWLIWQFANRGHLKGIDTYVDLNVLNKENSLFFYKRRIIEE